MIEWLKSCFREPGRFHIPPTSRPLPQCRIRPYEEIDFAACTEIYRLNEPGRFPPGYLDYFSEWLSGGRNLVLVCEVNGEIRGLGGLCVQGDPGADGEVLNFGMVHPEYHGKGFGTALLLARLITLPPPNHRRVIVISTTHQSKTFYRRFGFVDDRFTDAKGTEFDEHATLLYTRDWTACRNALSAGSIQVDTANAIVPPFDQSRIPDL